MSYLSSGIKQSLRISLYKITSLKNIGYLQNLIGNRVLLLHSNNVSWLETAL